ncbi:hypothetical protein Patl1_04842 [Pistacia atlantica]|uniref:Uncharacterized protein n=1 Tax=Pistacia atlantica TaxID=434234 RepID=A0ACC1BWM5_9ROSI|nr:hypothetical protein Patl1_04842 [Pistacia atlantica]
MSRCAIARYSTATAFDVSRLAFGFASSNGWLRYSASERWVGGAAVGAVGRTTFEGCVLGRCCKFGGEIWGVAFQPKDKVVLNGMGNVMGVEEDADENERRVSRRVWQPPIWSKDYAAIEVV